LLFGFNVVSLSFTSFFSRSAYLVIYGYLNVSLLAVNNAYLKNSRLPRSRYIVKSDGINNFFVSGLSFARATLTPCSSK